MLFIDLAFAEETLAQRTLVHGEFFVGDFVRPLLRCQIIWFSCCVIGFFIFLRIACFSIILCLY